ncbi:glycosyltransferase family 2 protein [Cryobacterium sp. Y11]|uniref:glycosyltransferase family 2 protein n=1 Tax=Cryobacterium sp. Y11 TaxID=2045016 RepID=UPI000CE3E88E|nr:glycosyltransferase family 2 protein [Cryobacterium sp. Y11]
MSSEQTLVVQSVLFGNDAHEIVRAAQAVANSVKWARSRGLIGEWKLLLGDCSPTPVLNVLHMDEIASTVGAEGGQFELHSFGANLGSAAGHNALASKEFSELILILNPDAIAGPGTLSVLACALDDGVGIAEARQIPLEHPKDFVAYSGDTSWASTACALTTRAAFDAVGGFDSDTFFLYCDDVDYSWRLRLAGYRVVYEPAARVFHDKRLTQTGDWPASGAEVYYSAEAALFMAHKYSRPEIVTRLLAQFRSEGSTSVLKAVAAFERKRKLGTLPTPLDAEHKVGQFIGDNYAVHRF